MVSASAIDFQRSHAVLRQDRGLIVNEEKVQTCFRQSSDRHM